MYAIKKAIAYDSALNINLISYSNYFITEIEDSLHVINIVTHT